MQKTLRRIISCAVLALLIVCGGLVTLLVFPQPLFATKMEYKKFRVYSDAKTDTALVSVLDDAYALASACELHDPAYRFDIFMAHNHIFDALESLQGEGPVARATAGNIIVKIPIDPAHNIAVAPRSRINLTELMTHEMVHILQTHRYGIGNFNPLKHPPYWKLEGYPEYVSRQAMLGNEAYDLRAEVARYRRLAAQSTDGFVEVVDHHFVPAVYYKGRLMIEYLINEKGLTYHAILADTTGEQAVFDEMVRWAADAP